MLKWLLLWLKRLKPDRCVIVQCVVVLPQTVLSTFADSVKFFLSVGDDMKETAPVKDAAVTDITEQLACDVEELCYKASIPVIAHKRICEKIRQYLDKYRNLLKPFKSSQNNPQYTAKLLQRRKL